MKHWLKRAGIGTALAGLTLGLAPSWAQASASSQWRVSYRSDSVYADPLVGVTAPGRHDAWAVGRVFLPHGRIRPLILHWRGSRWRAVAIPNTTGFIPSFVRSTSPGNVWIFGQTGVFKVEALVYNGNSWRTLPLPLNFDDNPVAVLGATDVWGISGSIACSAGSAPTCTTTLAHWNGATWTYVTIGTYVQDLAGAGNHVWLVGLSNIHNLDGPHPTGHPVVFRWTGSQWQQVTSPEGRVRAFPGIAASPHGDLWLMAPNPARSKPWHLDHLTGQRWTRQAVPAKLLASTTLTYDGHRGLWAGPYAHWTGTRWLNAFRINSMPGADGFGLVSIAAIPGSVSIWGAGWVGRTPASRVKDSLIAIFGGLP